MNADSYRMLVLVREFDDRFGWKKWACKSCAEWLAWRTSIKLSTAREKVRTAHALRTLPAIAAWDNRSLTAWRDEARGVLRLTVEVPIEEGELIVRALDCAVAGGEVTTDVDPEAVAESKGATWSAQQADALVAVAKSYLDGGHGGEGGSTADHYQVVVHADAKALTGGAGRSDLPIATVQRLLCDCSLVTVVEDPTGNPLDVGRKRDGRCARRRATWRILHHAGAASVGTRRSTRNGCSLSAGSDSFASAAVLAATAAAPPHALVYARP